MAILPEPIVYHNAGLGGNGGLDDLTSGGRDLTAFNSAEIIADTDSGGTQAFNMLPALPAVDSHFRDSSLSDFDNVQKWSCSAWIKHDGTTGKQVIVANHGMNKGNIQVYRSGSGLNFFNGFFDPTVSNNDNEILTVNSVVPTSDQWYHIAIVYDGSQSAIDLSTTQQRILCYVDGVQASSVYNTNGTQPNTIVTSNISGTRANYAIGAIQEVTTGGTPTGLIKFPFQGRIDSVRMWDQTLSTAQVTTLSGSRNVENSYPTGLGTEECWYCPSIDDSAFDLTGNGNDGTYQGGMTTTADSDPTYGGTRAYLFDGLDDYIECLNPPTVTNTNISYSLSLWVKVDSTAVLQPYATLVSDNGLQRSAYASNDPATNDHVCGHNKSFSSFQDVRSPNGTPTTNWMHLCYTYDDPLQEMKLYIDGSLVDTESRESSDWPNASTFDVGRAKYSTTEIYMSGRIDDVRFYKTALTQVEVDVLSSSRAVEGSGGGGSGGKNVLLLGVG